QKVGGSNSRFPCAGNAHRYGQRLAAGAIGVFGVNGDSIRHGHGGNARMLVAWLGCYEGMHRLR
ncbi:MAG: hypothetical protein ABI718_09450, partial [Acidobacteriota bacterium]